jgi:hypothetical protein
LKINQAIALFVERLQRLDDKRQQDVEELADQIEKVRKFLNLSLVIKVIRAKRVGVAIEAQRD